MRRRFALRRAGRLRRRRRWREAPLARRPKKRCDEERAGGDAARKQGASHDDCSPGAAQSSARGTKGRGGGAAVDRSGERGRRAREPWRRRQSDAGAARGVGARHGVGGRVGRGEFDGAEQDRDEERRIASRRRLQAAAARAFVSVAGVGGAMRERADFRRRRDEQAPSTAAARAATPGATLIARPRSTDKIATTRPNVGSRLVLNCCGRFVIVA